MGNLPALLADLILYISELFAQLQNPLNKPLYSLPSCIGTVFDPNTCFCILYDLFGPAVTAPLEFSVPPDLSDPVFSKCQQIGREWSFFVSR